MKTLFTTTNKTLSLIFIITALLMSCANKGVDIYGNPIPNPTGTAVPPVTVVSSTQNVFSMNTQTAEGYITVGRALVLLTDMQNRIPTAYPVRFTFNGGGSYIYNPIQAHVDGSIKAENYYAVTAGTDAQPFVCDKGAFETELRAEYNRAIASKRTHIKLSFDAQSLLGTAKAVAATSMTDQGVVSILRDQMGNPMLDMCGNYLYDCTLIRFKAIAVIAMP